MGTLVSRLLAVALLSGALGNASGAKWRIGSGAAAPGERLDIAVALVGDGLVSDAQIDVVIDESRVRFAAPPGELPSVGDAAGTCARVSSNRVRVLRVSASGAPASLKETVLCRIPLAVSPEPPSGVATLHGTDALCFSSRGSMQTCVVRHGAVRIIGGLAPTPPLIDAAPSIAVRLRAGAEVPSVDAIVSFD